MSHSQFHSIDLFILRHAWLNLWDKRMLLAESTRLLSLSCWQDHNNLNELLKKSRQDHQLYYVTVDDTSAHRWSLGACRSSLDYNFAEWGDIQSWLRFPFTGNVASDKIQQLASRRLSSYAFMPRLFVNLSQLLLIRAVDLNWYSSLCNSITFVNHNFKFFIVTWRHRKGDVVILIRNRSHKELNQSWTGSSFVSLG